MILFWLFIALYSLVCALLVIVSILSAFNSHRRANHAIFEANNLISGGNCRGCGRFDVILSPDGYCSVSCAQPKYRGTAHMICENADLVADLEWPDEIG